MTDGRVSFVDSPDFAYQQYVIHIVAAVDTSDSSSTDLNVIIIDTQNDAPRFAALPSAISVPENTAVSSVVYDVSGSGLSFSIRHNQLE